MTLPEPGPDDRGRRIGLLLIGVTLGLALIATAYVQWRQYDLLDGTTRYQNDALGWSFSQLETEHLRLRNEMQLALTETAGSASPKLQLRYDVFVSRLGLVDHGRAARIMAPQPIYTPTMARLRGFVQDADRYLGEKPSAPLTPQALHALLARFDTLSAPLHDLSLGASQLLYERVSQRNDAIALQSKRGIVLTAFQCTLLLGFGFIVLRQLRALLRHRARLETLATRLGAARVDAESASRAKSVFLANMSHEIRTPFHGLLGMLSLLQETPLSAQQNGYLHTAKESANHLLAILNDILDISKLESGKLQVEPEPVDLARLVREVDAPMRAQARAKGLELHLTMGDDVPRWVQADPTRLKQILFNLLSNAVKFTPAGHVHLTITTTEKAPGRVNFAVIDSGIGIDPAMHERVFQRFVQVDQTRSRRHAGAGLGLEISRSLARLMGGDITLESAPGAGSTFRVELPLTPVEAPPLGTTAPPAPSGLPARVLKVLVAEDHPVNRAYLEAVLDKLGHSAVFAENGEEAVRAVQLEDFDIVLMDLHMPVLDGFAATRAIRALPLPRGALPIVALSADAFQDSMELARRAGMDEMLTKPAHLPQLRELLARYGGASQARAPEPGPLLDSGDIVDRATVEQFQASLSPQKYALLLAIFFEAHVGTMERLRAAAASDDRRTLRDQSHALKGAALSLGLRAVVEQADLLQRGAVDAPAAELARRVDTLERQLLITRDLCQSLGWLPAAVAPAALPGAR